MKFLHRAGGALAVLALALAGCSGGGGAAPANTATAPQWLAVARGKVAVQGGMIEVAARTDGVVETVAVEQGDVVKRGQILATLDPRAAKIKVASAAAGVAAAQAQLAELQVALRQATRRAPRVSAAAKAGAASGDAASAATDAVQTLKAKHAAAAAALDAAQQGLAAARLELDATTLRAPVAGTVVLRHVAIGQGVAAASGQALFELLPARPHIVHAQLDVDAASAIHAGMHAEVVQDSGAGPVYAATVRWVGQVLQPASLTGDPLQRALANAVDCTLELAPAKPGTAPLRIGQRVLVRFPKGG
ncbi:MAG: HlyD family efflux transporter periplasmic adaptor subunit [Rhodanobacteraceae bacterium]|nr:MAG: HlyD family efflux transporter periplasmic adaptor subunit [Rhodanobacteraceae bacterium]